MGVSVDSIQLMVAESERRSFGGTILTLGVQDVPIDVDEFPKIFPSIAARLPVNTSSIAELTYSNNRNISDIAVFKALGFDDVIRTDASDYEGAEIIFDMNHNIDANCTDYKYLRNIIGECDVVFDGGTLEHIFHIPNALYNIFRLLRINGRIIHNIAPSSNHMDHGFYMFSPTLFHDYYFANRFEINTFKLVKYRMTAGSKWQLFDYVPGSFLHANIGSLDDAAYGIFLIATKTDQTTGDVVPQQSMYARHLWENHRSDADAPNDRRLKELDTLLFCRPHDADLLIEKARALLSAGRREAAITAWEAAARRLEGGRRAQVLAEMYFAAGNYPAALRCFSAALCFEPNNTLLLSFRMQTRLNLHQPWSALRDADRVVALLPANQNAYAQRAPLLERLGLFEDAATDWDQAHALSCGAAEYAANRDAARARRQVEPWSRRLMLRLRRCLQRWI